MKKTNLLFVLFLFFVAGCMNSENIQKVNNASILNDDKLLHLEKRINELEKMQMEFQSLSKSDSTDNNDVYDQLEIRLLQVEHIINHIPELEVKLGYIEESQSHQSKNSIRVQLIEMLDDNNSPNNYRIEKKGYIDIALSNDVLIYTLDGLNSEKVLVEELQSKINEYHRLFTFHIVDEKAILITEKYLP
ncbi:hypothetical protein RGU12_00575 [Fredinandcohnia sp. QZ13]|uniref:hypothetical protein n=1 Tax=Fredinandcohnia sp. QZ13 TaxID=3073144 RepID=UPI00285337DB|nr:hypothetical protein [Fredinandcohnia sp. QZ13]MDR4886037.1 hypothetical protein [Fredinandcohnia sp. QZ13]